jgi:hypothetical protein
MIGPSGRQRFDRRRPAIRLIDRSMLVAPVGVIVHALRIGSVRPRFGSFERSVDACRAAQFGRGSTSEQRDPHRQLKHDSTGFACPHEVRPKQPEGVNL